MASNLLLSIEIALDDTWYIKKTDDDGVFVKVNGYRAKNKEGNLMERVVDVRPAKEKGKECASKVEVRDNPIFLHSFCLPAILRASS